MKDLFGYGNLDAVDSVDFRPDKSFKKSETQSKNKERFKKLSLKTLINDKVISSRFGYGKRSLNFKRCLLDLTKGKFRHKIEFRY